MMCMSITQDSKGVDAHEAPRVKIVEQGSVSSGINSLISTHA